MKELIKALFLKEGFADAGFIPFNLIEKKLLDVKSVNDIPKDAKTVIMATLPYYPGEDEKRNISLYAVPEDYHMLCMDKLRNVITGLRTYYPANSFVPFVDSSPIPEVYAALKCGLGVLADNNLLITRNHGSFVFLCEIVTNLEVLGIKDVEIKHCRKCGLCADTCPSQALYKTEKGIVFDKSRCISFITQKKGELKPSEQALIKNSETIWGCDKCQTVCPFNKNMQPSGIGLNEKLIYTLKKSDIENLSLSDFKRKYARRAFSYRGKNVLMRNLNIKDE